MGKHGSAPTIEAGQFMELGAAVLRQLPRDIKGTAAQGWIDHPRVLGNALRMALMPSISSVSIEDVCAYWEALYREFFGMDVNLADLKIPEHQPGFDRVIVILIGLTLNRVIQVCEDRFATSFDSEDNWDRMIRHDRTARNESYAVRIPTGQKADERIKSLSVEQRAEQKMTSVTLLERLLIELDCFMKTGNLPSICNTTLCNGSYISHNRVPSVHWTLDNKLQIKWHDIYRDNVNVPPTLFVLVR